MTIDARALRPNLDEVAVEVLQGEAVLINLSTGHYYSMDKVGASVWQMIEAGLTPDAIASRVIAEYDVAPDRARDDITALLDDLRRERLAIDADGSVAAPAVARSADGERMPYETPRLNRYSDMADMLALDPPLPGLKDIPWKA